MTGKPPSLVRLYNSHYRIMGSHTYGGILSNRIVGRPPVESDGREMSLHQLWSRALCQIGGMEMGYFFSLSAAYLSGMSGRLNKPSAQRTSTLDYKDVKKKRSNLTFQKRKC